MPLRVGGIVVSAGGATFAALIRSLRVSDPGNETLEITADGQGNISITISGATVSAWNGTYTQDINGNAINETNLLAGPMCLVAPVIPSAAPTVGDSVTTTTGGLWLSAGADLVIEPAWRVNGVVKDPLFAYWGNTYKPRYPDVGSAVTMRETATDSYGSRTAISNATGNVTSPTTPTTVVVVGASVVNDISGEANPDLETPNAAATTLLQSTYGHTGTSVYFYGYDSTDGTHAVNMMRVARETHPDCLMVVHHTGGNVTDYRPFSTATAGEVATFQGYWEDMIAEANALGGPIYFASITYRTYAGVTPETPDGGSKPFNETDDGANPTKPFIGVIPLIEDLQTSQLSLTSYGRPYFDLYRKMLDGFDTAPDGWLDDNVHPNTAGGTALREYIVEVIDHIFDDTEPTEITERTVT